MLGSQPEGFNKKCLKQEQQPRGGVNRGKKVKGEKSIKITHGMIFVTRKARMTDD